MSATLELGATTTPKSEERSAKSVDLDALRKEIDDLAESIRVLKSSSSPDEDVGGDVISSKVRELLDLRRKYAENNDGIGADGKKFEEPLSKAEKKRREKAKKAAAAAAAGGGGGGDGKGEGEGGGEMSENAKKKAAKKAEKAARKAAMKAGGGGAAGAATRTTPAPSSPPRTRGGATASASASAAPTASSTVSLEPMEMAFNPNHPVHLRPVVALTAAVLCNVAPDLTLTSDHRRHNPALGMGNGGVVVVGDLAMARHLLRSSASSSAGCYGEVARSLAGGGGSPESVDQWLDYASSMMDHSSGDETTVDVNRLRALVATVNRHLTESNATYLAGGEGGRTLTLADVAVYAALGWPAAPRPPHLSPVGASTLDILKTHSSSLAAVSRWIDAMSSNPSIREATQLAVGIGGGNNNAEVTFATDGSDVLRPLHEGMNALEGATPGNVVTRFPPEPSGYLHIGHAKAVLLNDYYASRYRGRLIVRFDDTNPSKEKSEFEESIIEDLARLGVTNVDRVTYTSDYLDTIRGYAERMIQDGLAYMDDTDQETMQAERLAHRNSKHRDQSPDEAMRHFEEMCSGTEEGSRWCLRARMDMSSLNGTMRDPVIYRQNLTPHHRTGTTHKAYPTYDLACPIVDSLEGVTHALRTTEYNDRDEQYGWIQRSLGLRRVRIHSFARMNFMYTELSKRKLTWFVENGVVDGWDDPRMPTVRGVSRRGVSLVDALRDFTLMQGASRRVTLMDWAKFWAENRKVIDVRAGRYMAIAADVDSHVRLTVLNGPDVDAYEYVTTDLHPKDPTLGRRVVRIGREVLLEKVDVDGLVVGENIVLMRWGVVNVTKIGEDGGNIEGNFVPDGDFKAARRKLSWIADAPDQNTRVVLSEFDNLISKEKLDDGEDFKDFVNPNTRATSEVIGDALLRTLGEHDVIQLERRGYFRVDRPYVSESKPLMLFMIPDGKAKPMSGLAGQLAHR